MKQTTLNMLSNHALSIITGFLAGMVFIAGMSNISALETKDYWQTIGSLSAGFGTLAILVFGWLKADDWKKHQQYVEKRAALFEWHDMFVELMFKLEKEVLSQLVSAKVSIKFKVESDEALKNAKQNKCSTEELDQLQKDLTDWDEQMIRSIKDLSSSIETVESSKVDMIRCKSKIFALFTNSDLRLKIEELEQTTPIYLDRSQILGYASRRGKYFDFLSDTEALKKSIYSARDQAGALLENELSKIS